MIERIKRFMIKNKKSISVISILVLLSFYSGYKVAMEMEENRLRNTCSEILEISKEDIKYAKIKDTKLLTKVSSIKNELSTIDDSIYIEFDKDTINDLKERLRVKEIIIN